MLVEQRRDCFFPFFFANKTSRGLYVVLLESLCSASSLANCLADVLVFPYDSGVLFVLLSSRMHAMSGSRGERDRLDGDTGEETVFQGDRGKREKREEVSGTCTRSLREKEGKNVKSDCCTRNQADESQAKLVVLIHGEGRKQESEGRIRQSHRSGNCDNRNCLTAMLCNLCRGERSVHSYH